MNSPQATVIIVAAINLALMLLYASTKRMSGTWFDGIYFAFGDKLHRRFYLPLLHIELLWVLINGALLWLLFREPPQQESEQS